MYGVAGLCVLALLIVVGWFVSRELAAPALNPPVSETTAPTRTRHYAPMSLPEEDSEGETLTNQVAASAITNAAVLYRQAFALYDALTEEQKGIVSDWRTNVDASLESELCEKIQPICDLLHQAATASNCDWGVAKPFTYEMIGSLSPLLDSSRAIARAARWSAAHCRESDSSEAVSDLVAASRLGHNMPPILISFLVDVAIQESTLDFIAKHASTLAASDDPRLLQLVEEGQFDEPLLRGIERERDLTSERLSVKQLEASDEYMRSLREWETQYVKALQLPEVDYQEWLTHLHEAEKTNPLLGSMMSAFEIVMERSRRASVTTAMVAAGLAVTRDGETALQSHPDPSTGGPFTYTRTADGFELQSGYQFNGEPVKLRFK